MNQKIKFTEDIKKKIISEIEELRIKYNKINSKRKKFIENNSYDIYGSRKLKYEKIKNKYTIKLLDIKNDIKTLENYIKDN